MPFADFNDISLYFEEHGDGDPILLIAGLASDSQSWGSVVSELSHRFHVITLDCPGTGRTKPKNADFSISALAEICLKLTRHLGLGRINIIGHSMGGLVAQQFALSYPAYLDRLVLAATSSRLSARNHALFLNMADSRESSQDNRLWFENLFFWIFSPGFFENAGAVDIAISCACDYPFLQSNVAFRNQVNAMSDFDSSKSLSGIKAKTLVIRAEKDLLINTSESKFLAEEIPNAYCKVIDDAAHSIHIERPHEFVQAVTEFLDGAI